MFMCRKFSTGGMLLALAISPVNGALARNLIDSGLGPKSSCQEYISFIQKNFALHQEVTMHDIDGNLAFYREVAAFDQVEATADTLKLGGDMMDICSITPEETLAHAMRDAAIQANYLIRIP